MSTTDDSNRPRYVAVVGSGPAGFYAAEALLKADAAVRVDVIDRLPTPYGLVRAGVAPDHQKLKNVIRVYEKVAVQSGFGFLGNVTVGEDVAIPDLQRFYDAIVLAYGAESDRRLGIPGEDLPGSHPATAFVGWYNGHPDYRSLEFDLSVETAVVIGQGNVAMDVARILAKTVDELRETDIAAHALEALADSRIRDVHLIGRRGPAQAKFTPPEIREMGKLADCEPVVDPRDLELDPASRAELDDPANRHAQDNVAILREFAERELGRKGRRLHVRNFLSPVEIRGSGKVESIVLGLNRLEGEPFSMKAVSTGETIEIPCGLVLRSIGYHGRPLPGVPFDDRGGIVPNDRGRVVSPEGGALSGLYVAGWIKRGPTGIIGTNKPDAQETVANVLEDLDSLPRAPEAGEGALARWLAERGTRVVSFPDWQRIDELEIARGREAGKPREKFVDVARMLDAVAELTSGSA